MYSSNKLITILILLLVLALVQGIYFYPKLPATVPTHFNAKGEADGFSSRKNAVTVNIVLFAILSAFFYGLGKIAKKLPDNLINVPNREYWLSEKNREKTFEVIACFGMKIGIATQIFLLFLFQRMYKISITNQDLNARYFWFGFILYIVYIIYVTWKIYQFFNQKGGTSGLQS